MTCGVSKSDNRREVAPKRLRVAEQQRVDESKQLHHTLILTKVLVTFQQELILLTIATYKSHLTSKLSSSQNL